MSSSITWPERAVRSVVSYVPSSNLLALRELRDLPSRLRRGVHEEDFRLLRHFDRQPSLVLDVGANRGQSIRSLGHVLRRPRVVAVEPHEHLAAHLRSRFARRDVEVVNCGLGDEPGSITLHVPVYGHTEWDTRAAADEEMARTFLSPEQFLGFDARRARIVPRTICIRRLDDLDVAPDIVKVDVEGQDLAALRGGVRTLSQHSPVLLVEDPGPESVELLDGLGYTPFTYVDGRLVRGRLDSLNTFFLREEHLARLPGGVLGG